MWLGHFFLGISLAILRALHLYRDIEEVAEEKLDHVVAAFNAAGFAIQVRQ